MEQAIRDLPRQFEFEPVIENESALRRAKRIIVCGMGGSNLATGLLAMAHPREDIRAHRDFGLPFLPNGDLEASFIVANSYSGNTEETVDAFETALERELALAAIATGGILLELAKKRNIPFIRIPATGIQPRSALGFQVRAFLKLLGDEKGSIETQKLSTFLDIEKTEKQGKALAKKLAGTIPVIYASARNKTLSHIWKIKFNETAKIPAFCNTFPELNHNEMTGFDAAGKARPLVERFHFIFLRDEEDAPKILKRMTETAKLFKKMKFGVEILPVEGRGFWHKIFDDLTVADWTSLYLARHYGADPDAIPLVEEFKKRMA
ncbi:MAG: hypothetical protein HYT22_02990 [Candidatus Niyogibacteria bacterium]|nr:hypothetical protein [Candidatus Niyogibacteria bacterium]